VTPARPRATHLARALPPRVALPALAVLAAVLPLAALLPPRVSGVAGPALLAGGCALAAAAVAVRAASLPVAARRPWRCVVAVGTLLALAQVLAALQAAGALPASRPFPWEYVPLTLAVLPGVLGCLRLLPRGDRRRPGARTALDAAVVLVAVALLGEVLLGTAAAGAGRVGGFASLLWPLAGAVLCSTGLLAAGSAPPGRRRAAGWLLLSCGAAAAVAVGSLVDPAGGGPVGLGTRELWLLLAAAGVAAAAADRPAAAEAERPGTLPLTGLLVGHSVAYAVTVVLVGLMATGRPVRTGEALAVLVLVLLTSLRTLLWAREGRRLTHRLARTEAWFRALVHSADDVTVVVDGPGTVSWVSGAVRAQLGWAEPQLLGRVLTDLVHPDDRAGLAVRAAAARAGGAAEDPIGVRLVTAAGRWRDVEVSGLARAGLPGSAAGDGLVVHLRDVTERRTTERELERMAWTDYLTRLPNRARFMAALDTARGRAAAGEGSCLLLLDLDGFKAVNDVAGHEAGDQLLREVADVLRGAARDGDVVARLGGDEFAFLVTGSLEEATGLAERLVPLLTRPFRFAGEGGAAGPAFSISGSIGVAEVQPGDDATAAVRRADIALRAAKADGKGCVRSSGQAIENALARRALLARDLPAALEQGQLELRYQPVVGLDQRRVLGVEALVRWEHPLLGTVPPEEFICLAEDDGLIVPLQRWVLATAAADLAPLDTRGYDLQLGVNVSVRHLQAGCLVPDVAEVLARTGLPARRLMLEITEGTLMGTDDRIEGDLVTLNGMGCVVSLDDFGRGWSSLAHLARLPVSVVKMDRAFVAGIAEDRRAAALVGSVVELGRTLGMDVVAEGVETAGQLAALRELGCVFVQGYALGRPVPAAELAAVADGFDAAVLDAVPLPRTPVSTEWDSLVDGVPAQGAQ
jgi:diguanylate cyclase (GGDEF)-like protein/PAS domain S-box-containing protein